MAVLVLSSDVEKGKWDATHVSGQMQHSKWANGNVLGGDSTKQQVTCLPILLTTTTTTTTSSPVLLFTTSCIWVRNSFLFLDRFLSFYFQSSSPHDNCLLSAPLTGTTHNKLLGHSKSCCWFWGATTAARKCCCSTISSDPSIDDKVVEDYIEQQT